MGYWGEDDRYVSTNLCVNIWSDTGKGHPDYDIYVIFPEHFGNTIDMDTEEKLEVGIPKIAENVRVPVLQRKLGIQKYVEEVTEKEAWVLYGASSLPPQIETIALACYRDATHLFTEEECDIDNICAAHFPKEVVDAFLRSCRNNIDFDQWYFHEYTADDTLELIDFAARRGWTLIEGDVR